MRTQRKLTEEHREKIRNSLKGRKRDESTKQKISIGMKRYWETIPVEVNKEDINVINEQKK